jgi:transposase InsO family protein
LITFYTLFVIELRSRLVQVCGTTVSPNGQWMKQMGRQLTDGMDGFAQGKTHLIIDRDTKYGEGFRQILEAAGMKIVLCPPRVPQCNAIAERFVRSIKSENGFFHISTKCLRVCQAWIVRQCWRGTSRISPFSRSALLSV